jgi:hypothetical protein
VVVLALGDVLERLRQRHPGQYPVWRLGIGAAVCATALSLMAVMLPWTLTTDVSVAGWTIRQRRWIGPQVPRAMMWIRGYTPRDAIFLIDPSTERFYLNAERPMFVTWKHGPQSNAALLEWFDRLTLVNGQVPQRRGFGLRSELHETYQQIDEHRIRAIMQRYKLDYCVVPARTTLPFARVYLDRTTAIYALR